MGLLSRWVLYELYGFVGFIPESGRVYVREVRIERRSVQRVCDEVRESVLFTVSIDLSPLYLPTLFFPFQHSSFTKTDVMGWDGM